MHLENVDYYFILNFIYLIIFNILLFILKKSPKVIFGCFVDALMRYINNLKFNCLTSDIKMTLA